MDLMSGVTARLELLRAWGLERCDDESGQTATEYLGIIAVVAVIIGVLLGAGFGEEISGFISDKIAEVAG